MATSEQQVIHGMFAADSWQYGLARNAQHRVMDCWQNVKTIVECHPAWEGVIGFDEFAQTPTKRRAAPTGAPAGPWMASDDMLLGMWLQQQLQMTVKSLGNISTGVQACAQAHPYHELRDWLNSLQWDKTERLEHWLEECFGIEGGPYASLAGRYFLISMVARVFEPGCIMRSVPVLEGAQERGKSTGLRVLAGDGYFADTAIDLGSKDAYEQIQGVWLYEISEMHSFNRAEATRVKQFISSPVDTWVPKYVRGRVSVKRQVVFAGSTNESLYLKDWTGNTRFWPLRCEANGERINLERIASQREQLFAEAVVRYKAGERRYPTAEEAQGLFEPEQAARLIEHPWMEVIRGWLAGVTVANVTAVEVLHEACKVETSKMTMLQMQDVGRLMSLLGWERRRKSTGDRGWFYVRPQQVSESRQNDEEKPF